MSSEVKDDRIAAYLYGGITNLKTEKGSIVDFIKTENPDFENLNISESVEWDNQSENDKERFECEFCDKSFKYKHGLTEHTKHKHGMFDENQLSVESEFLCNFCNKKFASSYSLHRHLSTHSGVKQFPCKRPDCTQTFGTETDMKRHIEEDHMNKKFSCNVCRKMFTRISNLNRHMKLHNNIREYPCTLCGKEFTQRVHRDKHLLIHFRTSNQCPKCDTVYTKVKYFNNHVTNVCFASSPPRSTGGVKCPICKMCTRDYKRLRGHIIHVHHVDNICPQCNTKHDDFDMFVKHLGECYSEDVESASMLADFANSLLDSFQYN